MHTCNVIFNCILTILPWPFSLNNNLSVLFPPAFPHIYMYTRHVIFLSVDSFAFAVHICTGYRNCKLLKLSLVFAFYKDVPLLTRTRFYTIQQYFTNVIEIFAIHRCEV
jgi:hypothetical protein